MLCLPSLIGEPGRGELPLDDRAALALIEAILTHEESARFGLWCRLLAESPPLVLWLCCRSHRWQKEPPNDLTEIAQVAATRGTSLFATAPPIHWPEAEAAAMGAEEALRRASVARALHAAERSGADETQSTTEFSQPYVFGLLGNGPDWLALSRLPIDEPAVRRNIPPWLMRLWTDRQSPGGRQERTSHGQATAGTMEAPPAASRQEHAADSCLSSDRGIAARLASRLPWLVARMARLEQLEQQFEETLQQEKLESLRQFAYGASHEINNPLANISTRAQTLLREETHPERRRKLATINAQAFRAHEMISDMMLFAKPPELVPEPLDVSKVVGEVLSELAEMAESQGTQLVYRQHGRSLPCVADRVQLAVALTSLCTNALEAIPSGGRIEITAAQRLDPTDRSEWLVLSVSDTGPGIPPEVHRHLFDPYYSGREAGRGLGLGLAKCWRIVTLHGGRIEVASGAGQGATFEIHLPQRSGEFEENVPGN